jgi:phosphohistidine phosphatase SixA
MDPFQGSVILIRHADATHSPMDDPQTGPPLNELGVARAAELPHVLRTAGIAEIFVSQFRRSQDTAKPLQDQLHVAVRQIDAENEDELDAAIRALPASSVGLVIGHSNTVPAVIERLGVPADVSVGEKEFDNLFVLSGGRLTRLRYGAEHTD